MSLQSLMEQTSHLTFPSVVSPQRHRAKFYLLPRRQRQQQKCRANDGTGDGAVDAIFKAIEKLVNSETQLQLYSVNAVTQGTDSQGEVTVRLEKNGRIINGMGADTDILVASAKAYLNALTLMRNPGRLHPQLGGV